MRVSRLELKNWRNFRAAEADLQERVFVVGPNASGKSNLLDVFRFLRDVAKSEGGGLQKAIRDRGGISKIRCLAARSDPEIRIAIDLSENGDDSPVWTYALGIKQQPRGDRLPYVSEERVTRGSKIIVERPDKDDHEDPARLTQTYLEQINSNAPFRDVSKYLQSVTYLHLVPQLVRHADAIQGRRLDDDPFGQGFLESVALASPKTRKARLERIQDALKVAVPQMKELRFTQDQVTGRPHLEALYSHWRPGAGWQREDQFSDGTLRLLGLMWSLLEHDSLLLLEEPELSLNAAIVRRLPGLISRIQRARQRQVLISTHSADLLSDQGIDASEVLFLSPNAEGTTLSVASQLKQVKVLLQEGLSIGEAILPIATPKRLDQLALFP